MKKIVLILFLLPVALFAQIENVIVETYYVSDASDALDSSGGFLEQGSKTYRIYIDLKQGSKIKSIYGDKKHTLRIASSEDFFNNSDRGDVFGYNINKKYLSDNTVALDSWITLRRATKTLAGVLKSEDTDGSLISNLKNDDASAGIAIADADGLVSDTTVIAWFTSGIGDSSTFGIDVKGSEFVSDSALIQVNKGVSGITSSNTVLVAQLTTRGEIAFELNAEVIDSSGNDIFYVASGSDYDSLNSTGVIVRRERLSPFLKYPPECGCRDPRYREYSQSYACDDSTACKTPVVFGCMDTMACNFDVQANFSVPSLCCYPGYCSDRNLAVVCHSIVEESGFIVYPNPAEKFISISFLGEKRDANLAPVHFAIYNGFGNMIMENDVVEKINISNLNPGIYMIRMFKEGTVYDSKTFMKN